MLNKDKAQENNTHNKILQKNTIHVYIHTHNNDYRLVRGRML